MSYKIAYPGEVEKQIHFHDRPKNESEWGEVPSILNNQIVQCGCGKYFVYRYVRVFGQIIGGKWEDVYWYSFLLRRKIKEASQ